MASGPRGPKVPTFKGWLSSDADEIKRREWRGRTEIDDVLAIGEFDGPFGDYRVRSSSGNDYVVELRSLAKRVNSCGCRDFDTNGLGTCKHIEGVRQRIRGQARKASNRRIEVYADAANPRSLRMDRPNRPDAVVATFANEVGSLCNGLRRGSPPGAAPLA